MEKRGVGSYIVGMLSNVLRSACFSVCSAGGVSRMYRYRNDTSKLKHVRFIEGFSCVFS